MAQQDYYTNIMLDLECATPSFPDPVIIELAAVHFDIDTGAELDHYTTIINFESCQELGLKQDQGTLDWLNVHIPDTLEASKAGGKPLRQALSEFKAFVQRCRQATRKRIEIQSLPYDFAQPMIWGNGAVADNVWIASAYRACKMERPWKFYNDMCVRTFVKQAKAMTGRDFKNEAKFQGEEHVALDDCRHQITYLVNARNALLSLSRPMVELKQASPEALLSSANEEVEQALKITLPSPETSLSSADGDVEHVLSSTTTSLDEFEETLSEREAFLEIVTSSQEVQSEGDNENSAMIRPRVRTMLFSPVTSFSSADGDVVDALRSAASSLLEPSSNDHRAPPEIFPSGNAPINMKVQENDGQELATNARVENSPSVPLNGHRVRDVPYKVTKSAPNGNQRQRGAPMKSSRQLLTPETSFNAEDIEQEDEVGKQQDERIFGHD